MTKIKIKKTDWKIGQIVKQKQIVKENCNESMDVGLAKGFFSTHEIYAT